MANFFFSPLPECKVLAKGPLMLTKWVLSRGAMIIFAPLGYCVEDGMEEEKFCYKKKKKRLLEHSLYINPLLSRKSHG